MTTHDCADAETLIAALRVGVRFLPGFKNGEKG